MEPITPALSPSLLSLAKKLDQREIIPLARVFGSAASHTSTTARDLDIAFFCSDPYYSPEGRKFAGAVARQVLVHGSRRHHYGELDVFIFFPDRSVVRNGECNGWEVAKAAKSIKAAATQGQPWLDFMRAVDPDWDHASCPPLRLRQWVCSEYSYPLDADTVASMARASADLSPWIGRAMVPRNILMEAIEWNHQEIIPALIAAGAPVMPDLPVDPEDQLDFSGEAYLPSVAALIRARTDLEDEGLESTASKIADLVEISALLVRSGADPLRFDLGGNAVNTMEAFMALANDIQEQSDEFPVPSGRLPEAMGCLIDAMLDSLPLEMAAQLRQDVCSGAIDAPGHELNRLACAPDVMGLWLASVRHHDLDGGVADLPASPIASTQRRM